MLKPQAVVLRVDGVSLGRTATMWRPSGDDPQSHNTLDEQPIAIDEEDFVEFGAEVTVAAYSVNLYRVAVE